MKLVCSVVMLVCGIQPLLAMIELEGCFENVDMNLGESHTFEGFNVNEDCGNLCANQGFILSVTHGDLCHCTNIMPGKQNLIAAPHKLKSISGDVSPCGIKCPGVVQKSTCMGDECCGGMYRGYETYSVYAVGGIDAVKVVKHRILQSLMNPESRAKMTWLKPEIKTLRCYNNFTQHEIMHGNVKLVLKRGNFRAYRRVPTLDVCKAKCIANSRCKSLTYFIHNAICSLNYQSSMEAKVTLTNTDTILLDRNCKSNVEILPSSFQLDVVDQKLTITYDVAGSNPTPLGDEDFEIDLTESNNWDTVRRTVSVTDSQDVQISTQTGFELSESQTTAKDSSKTTTKDTNTESTSGSSSASNSGFNVGLSVTAKVGFDWGFVSASVSTTVDTNFNMDFSSTSGFSSSRQSSTSSSYTGSLGRSVSQLQSSAYNRGYTRSHRSDLTQLYDYSMTVAALHKGTIAFVVNKTPVIIKVRTLFNLNGYVKFLIDGIEHDVHVARVLPAYQREMAILSTVMYERSVLAGKIIIRDRHGNDVVEPQEK